MAEMRHAPSVPEVEAALGDVGQRLSYPPTPDLAPVIAARLAARTTHQPARALSLSGRRRLALAILAAVLAVVLVLAVSPGARQVLASRIGVPGIVIKHVPAMPSPPPGVATSSPSARSTGAPVTAAPLASPSVLPIGNGLGLGEQATLTAASAKVGFQVLVPQALGTPDELYVAEPTPSGEVSLVYRTRPGLPVTSETGVGALLGEFRGTVQPGLFQKLLGPDSHVVAVAVAGYPGYWITGSPHLFLYQDPNGVVRQESIRLAGNTLIWEQGGITFRLESALDEEGALKVAASVR